MTWTPSPLALARVKGYAHGFVDGLSLGLGTRRRALHAELVEERRERALLEDELNACALALDRVDEALAASIEEVGDLREQLADAHEDLGDRRAAVVDHIDDAT